MKIGINTDCECGNSIKEIMQNIKAAGFENIMLAERSGDLDTNLDLARAMGLAVSFVHLGYSDINNMWKYGPANHEFVKNFTRRLEILYKYGVKTAVIHSYGFKDSDEAKTSLIERGVATMKQILEIAKKLDIRIAVENLNTKNTAYTRALLDNIDSSNFGLCYDAGHKNLHTPETDLLALYGTRCFEIHLHDNMMDDRTGMEGNLDHHLLPFDGKIDFEKEMRNLAAVGFRGAMMLEINRHDWVNKVPRPIYAHLSIVDFLKLAKTRAKKLVEFLKKVK